LKSRAIALAELASFIAIIAVIIWSALSYPQDTPVTAPAGTPGLSLNILDNTYNLAVNDDFGLSSAATISSTDGKLKLSLSRGTIILDQNDENIKSVNISVDPAPPPVPANTVVVGQIYSLSPDGAAIILPARITVAYDLSELPEGINEGDIYISYYYENQWSSPGYNKIDTLFHNITGIMNHANRFAIFAPLHGSNSLPNHPDGQTKFLFAFTLLRFYGL